MHYSITRCPATGLHRLISADSEPEHRADLARAVPLVMRLWSKDDDFETVPERNLRCALQPRARAVIDPLTARPNRQTDSRGRIVVVAVGDQVRVRLRRRARRNPRNGQRVIWPAGWICRQIPKI